MSHETIFFSDDPYYCGLRARIPNFAKSRAQKEKEREKQERGESKYAGVGAMRDIGGPGDITWCGAAPSGDTWTTVSKLRSPEVTATPHCLCLRST